MPGMSAVLLLLPTGAFAAPVQDHGQSLSHAPAAVLADRPPYQLVYDHLTGTLELRDHKGRPLERWDRKTTASAALVGVPIERPITVIVENANSLLYDYDVTVAPVARTGVQTCRNVGARFTTMGLIPGLSVVTGALAPTAVGETVVGDVIADMRRTSRGEGRVSLATVQGVLERVRAPLAEYLGFADRVTQLAVSLDDSLGAIAELSESLPIDSLLARLQSSVAQLGAGFQSPASVSVAVRQRAAALAPPLRQLTSLGAMIQAGQLDGDPAAPAAREVVALAARADSASAGLQAVSRTLQLGLRRIEIARTRSRQTFTTGPSADVRRLALELRPTADFTNLPRLFQGTVEVFTEPKVSWVCALTLGVAWMDQPPRFDVEGDSIIVDRSAGERRSTPMLALRMSSSRLPQLAALAGVGMGTRQRPDFYLGGALRVLRPLVLSAGVVWQWQDRLPAGFRPGQAVPDRSVLGSVTHAYATTMFWSLGLGL